MEENEIKVLIKEEVKNQLKGGLFTARKITDTPTDNLQVTPRSYVTRNFTTLLRPVTSVVGESYFDKTAGKPAWWEGTKFVDGAGTIV